MAGLVVIGYDGSGDAQRAIDVAASVLGADSALVINVWQGSLAAATAAAPLGVPVAPTPEDDDARLERAGREIADEGAARARDAGLAAESDVRRGDSAGEIGTALLDAALERDADLVVVGRRGISRIQAVVLGSVSDAAVRDGRRPVLVVPAAD
jgi:nucleotide-binding universal stress UspA family protein